MPGTAINCTGGTLTTAGSAYSVMPSRGTTILERKIWNADPLANIFVSLGGTATLNSGPLIPPLGFVDVSESIDAVTLCADEDNVVWTCVEI